ncbi:hypothetical protein [Winogradskyella sp.]|uniref:hypothetical protein n=1 Tax=Winogradskyella sp. TaxID=1883156 RepID=UPI003BA90DC2
MKLTFAKYVFLVTMLCSCKENTVCENYKIGEFYEIVYSYPVIGKKVKRNDSTQVSIIVLKNGKATQSSKDFYTIKWINDCDYILKNDESKMEMDEDLQEINRNGGFLYEFQWRDNTYLYYNCTVKLDNYESKSEHKIRVE